MFHDKVGFKANRLGGKFLGFLALRVVTVVVDDKNGNAADEIKDEEEEKEEE